MEKRKVQRYIQRVQMMQGLMSLIKEFGLIIKTMGFSWE